MTLKGKKAIVTGGSRGIGNAIVREFLREGATVYGLSRKAAENQAELEAAAAAGRRRLPLAARRTSRKEEELSRRPWTPSSPRRAASTCW